MEYALAGDLLWYQGNIYPSCVLPSVFALDCKSYYQRSLAQGTAGSWLSLWCAMSTGTSGFRLVQLAHLEGVTATPAFWPLLVRGAHIASDLALQ